MPGAPGMPGMPPDPNVPNPLDPRLNNPFAQPTEPGMHPPAYRIRPSGEHGVGLAGGQQVVSISQGIVSGGAGRGQ